MALPGQMTLEQLLSLQYLQQEYFEGDWKPDREWQRQLALQYVNYAEGQFDSYRRAIGYKHFLPLREASRDSRIMELIDAFKYTLAAMWTEGVTAAELQETFVERTDTVYARHQESHATFQHIAGFDIDGVIADLAASGYYQFPSDEARWEFFQDREALNLPLIPGARRTLQAFRNSGWNIVLVTARKIRQHARLEHDTYAWLRKNEIPYDTILWGYDKADAIAKSKLHFAFFVEDNPKHAIDLASQGYLVYLTKGPEYTLEHANIRVVNKIREIGWLYGVLPK